MRVGRLLWVTFLWLGIAATIQAQPPVSPEHVAQMAKGTDLFKKHVGPILVGRCLKCHGGEESESELDLTTRESLLRGGAEGPVVVLGKSAQSRLYKLVAHLEEPHMPANGAKLEGTDLAAIAAWIDSGAPYSRSLKGDDADPAAWTKTVIDETRREFWSFQPLKKLAPPVVTDDAWSLGPLDKFVLAAARDKQLTPNPLADRRTLIRRAQFDLIGLPPSAEEVERFFNDPQSDDKAFEHLIDRLLESPQYGERWGRHWLDVARFAESHGFEQDYDRPHAYHFRDFVIKALNADMPFDQFVRWQLAGDEFEPQNPLAMMATGFLGAGVFPTQLTEKEFEAARYDELDDMVSTTGTAMLGLTLGCARCHDHKFDPIPAADYYRIVASFATTIRSEVELELDPEKYRREKDAYENEHGPLVAALQQYETDSEMRFAKWLADPANRQPPEAKWQVLDLVSFKSNGGATMTKLDDGSILVGGENPKHDHYTFVGETRLRNVTAVRLDTLIHPSFVKGGPGRASNGNFALSDFTMTSRPLADSTAKATVVKLIDARATHQQDSGHLAVKSSIDDGPESGWAVDLGGIGKEQAAVFDFAQPVDAAGGVRLTFEMRFSNNGQHSIGRPRLSLGTVAPPVAIEGQQINQHLFDAYAILREGGPEALNEMQRAAMRRRFFEQDPNWQELYKLVLNHEAKQPKPVRTKVMVTSEGVKPIPHHADDRGFPHFYPDVYFVRRGDAQQKVGVASQGFLQVLTSATEKERRWQSTPPAGSKTSYRRRALANWLTDTERGAGHLLARVIVNRLWQHHFGQGLVATPNDFGYQGRRPSHPELLEWLAGKLIDNGWRLKPIHQLMMSSATYRQMAAFDEADARRDPENAWLWRFAPRRLEAEIIRDSILAISGELDRTQFGPGTLDEGMKRRSIYFMIKRSKLVPSMQLFDAPEPLVGVGSRPSTTIAPQSLLFMNGMQVRGAARSFAKRLLAVGQETDAAVRLGYVTALSRPPNDIERQAAAAFLARQIASYRDDNQAATALELALTDFCQVLLALNEFVFVN